MIEAAQGLILKRSKINDKNYVSILVEYSSMMLQLWIQKADISI